MSTPQRARRAPRPSGEDRQRAIVDAVEDLLRTRPLAEISIDEVAAAAGLSRSAFYFYFGSKQAVLLELLDRMVAEVDARLAALPLPDEPSRDWWRSCLAVFVDVFGAHRAVSLSLAEARATVPELREEWSRRLAGWVDLTTATITAEQRRGRAGAVVDPRATSVLLNTMNERAIAASLAGEEPSLPPGSVLDALTDLWCTAVYGTPDP
ncbi:TetR/AcrR family transcriptional regulator [uncultured Pseudokineococcus sp.]|uniref:TetR/AcrR family transcriptional regulator n=1 Tax=uncultured Pseudokineococcus sp. TaxID=1642928 RepID=UPI00262B1294|nr:TetR/AcrR family transcriptional regulator [uncultured Pseudokineococcus sp.]